MTRNTTDEAARRQNLARFGYKQPGFGRAAIDLDLAWPVLRRDFVAAPELVQLAPAARELLQRYADQRAEIDGLLETCDAAHAEILQHGARPDLVEVYAEARDAYEDAVEAFGALRAAVATALSTTPAQ